MARMTGQQCAGIERGENRPRIDRIRNEDTVEKRGRWNDKTRCTCGAGKETKKR